MVKITELLFSKNKRKEEPENKFELINRHIKGDGRNKSVQQDSILLGFYKDFLITKDGYIVGGINVTGINTDLLTKFEKNDLITEYSSFLANTMKDKPMIKTITEPVNMQNYIKILTKQVLEELKNNNNEPTPKAQLLASRIIFLRDKQVRGEMSTKEHLVFYATKIEDDSVTQLEHAVHRLNEMITMYKNEIRKAFDHYSVDTRTLVQEEYLNKIYSIYDYKNYNEYHLTQ
ncbi:TrsD/TraD family conjugative transfer protein [Macrococcus armenti]|uniref:TrsD/TraD family conjugative transfer protein n=1 Tax=Macrococcus armenti TaxID=2875764 RepID=UPI001CCC3624|nr:TrsD/TraD family conjugative transfer protein [Macrococcus armenti]UBH09781.1 traD [Macrococcus armenti]